MAHGHKRSLLTFFANICESMALGGQINHPIGFYVKFRVYIGLRYMYTYVCLIILDADFDEDSDSDLRLEIGAHLDLVFEG